MDIMQVLSSNNYLVINKDLIKTIGLHQAILLCELASEYNYYSKQNKLEADGSFFSTIENVENQCGLGKLAQANAIKALKDLKMIDVKITGIPAKRFITLDINQIASFLIAENKFADSGKLVGINQQTSMPIAETNNNNNNNKRKEINNINNNNQEVVLKKLYGNKGTIPLSDKEHEELKELFKDRLDEIILKVEDWIINSANGNITNFKSLIIKFGNSSNSYSKQNKEKEPVKPVVVEEKKELKVDEKGHLIISDEEKRKLLDFTDDERKKIW